MTRTSVGLGHGGGAHGADEARMVGRDEAAALLGVEIDRTRGVEQAHQLGAAVAGAAAGDDQRPPGRPQGLDRGGDAGRDRAGGCAAAWGASSRRARAARARACAARRSGSRCRPGRARRDRPWRGPRPRRARGSTWSATRSGAGVAADRAQDVGVRDVLQRAHVGLGPRGAAADQQHRHRAPATRWPCR